MLLFLGLLLADPAGYVRQTGALLVTDTNVHIANMTLIQAEAWCTACAECVAFTFACNDTDSSHLKNTCTTAEEAKVRARWDRSSTHSTWILPIFNHARIGMMAG